MKFALIFTLLVFSFASHAQTVCFENDKVKMLDVIDLDEQNVPRPTSDKVTKLAAAQKDAVKETKVMGYSLNSGPREDIKVNYYKNSASEDVAVFKYNGHKYYKVRNLKMVVLLFTPMIQPLKKFCISLHYPQIVMTVFIVTEFPP